jgi:hypothetical protein
MDFGLSFVVDLFGDFFTLMKDVFFMGGWIIIPMALFFLLYIVWHNYIAIEYLKKIKYVLLSINVPAELERSPKVADVIFHGFHSIQTGMNFIERHFTGKQQEWFSLEMVSINGEVRFLIRTPVYYKDLVESHIYAHYPDAEISEIRDYVDSAPDKFPDDQVDMFAAEYDLAKPDGYPIRTYRSFEGPTPETTVDPLSTLLEVMGNITTGEQIWIQFLIKPTGSAWREDGEKIVKKLIGAKVPEKKRGAIMQALGTVGSEFTDIALNAPVRALGGEVAPADKVLKKEAPVSLVQYLSPGEIDIVTAIQENISKVGFETKLRFVYIATKDKFGRNVKARVNGVRGGLEKPFSSAVLNSFSMKKNLRTKVDYFKRWRVPYRQRLLMKKYKLREFADKGFVFNTEELATVYHFPDISVRTATLRRAEAKKSDAPADIPFEPQ